MELGQSAHSGCGIEEGKVDRLRVWAQGRKGVFPILLLRVMCTPNSKLQTEPGNNPSTHMQLHYLVHKIITSLVE